AEHWSAVFADDRREVGAVFRYGAQHAASPMVIGGERQRTTPQLVVVFAEQSGGGRGRFHRIEPLVDASADPQIFTARGERELPDADRSRTGPGVLVGRFHQRQQRTLRWNLVAVHDSSERIHVSPRSDHTVPESFLDAALGVDLVEQVTQDRLRWDQALVNDRRVYRRRRVRQLLRSLERVANLSQRLFDAADTGIDGVVGGDAVNQVHMETVVNDDVVCAVAGEDLLPELDPRFETFGGECRPCES